MIECHGLGKNYANQVVVEDLDLIVEEGELLVLIGASGSGKTTTLIMLNRLIEPTTCRILIDGELQPDLFTRDEIRAILTGRYRLVLDSESTLGPSDTYMDHGHQGIVFHRGGQPFARAPAHRFFAAHYILDVEVSAVTLQLPIAHLPS